MRIQGKLRLGYFPLPLEEARRIRAHLRFRASPFSAIDPCIGDGAAFVAITGGACARRYGVELDAHRAEQAAAVVDEVIHGDCFQVHCPVESCELALLNPPYDWISGESRSERTERVFLAHTYRWLKVGGVLILVVPAHVRECPEILAAHFKAIRLSRLTDRPRGGDWHVGEAGSVGPVISYEALTVEYKEAGPLSLGVNQQNKIRRRTVGRSPPRSA